MLIYVPSKIPFVSLRVKLVILIALPMFITLAGLSYYQYYLEQQTLLKQLDDIAYNFGEVIVGSLRHTMLERDPSMTKMVLNEIGSQSSILHTALYNSKSELVATNAAEYFGDADRSSPGCVECHQNGNNEGFRSLVIQTPTREDVLRTDIPIRNEPECYSCHSKDDELLGVLVIDYSLEALNRRVASGITVNLIVSLLVTLAASLAVLFWIEALVIRRLKLFSGPIQLFGDGDFGARVKGDASIEDEITGLQKGFNQMAAELERQAELEQKAIDARFQAIIEERKRLARELHDSTAQILGYVTTKAATVRLFIEKGSNHEAVSELRQLEDAARSVFEDIRQAIMDLNTIPDEDWDLVKVLRTYTDGFQRYSQIPTLLIVESVDDVLLPPENYLQLLRIVQEALANVRKHSSASKVEVHITVDTENNLVILIKDNGVGFDLDAQDTRSSVHFGLNSMRERAQSISASLEIKSEPGNGSQLKVILPLGKKE